MLENMAPNERKSEFKRIVPVSVPNQHEHNVKYLILNEQPSQYICESGCIHSYPRISPTQFLATPKLPQGQQDEIKGKKILKTYSKEKEQRDNPKEEDSLPVAYKYLPSGKTVVTTVQQKSILRLLDDTKNSSKMHSPGKILPRNNTPTRMLTQENTQTKIKTTLSKSNDENKDFLRNKVPVAPLPHETSSSTSNVLRDVKYDSLSSHSELRIKSSGSKNNIKPRNSANILLKCKTHRLSDSIIKSPDESDKTEKTNAFHTNESAFVPLISTDGIDKLQEYCTGKFGKTRSASPTNSLRDQRIKYEYNRNNANVFERLYPKIVKPIIPIEDNVIVNKIEPKRPLTMSWTRYHRLQVIYEFMDELENEFPSLVSVGVIGKSLEGRDIKLMKISNGNTSNSPVWIDAGIHAREWIGPAVNTYVANYIARNFDNLPPTCTNKDWFFLPVANPDGYEYSHTDHRMWRKNKAIVRGKCVGVDINRNFSVAWGGRGSSDDPNHSFYRGTHPFSEPESCAMKNVLQDAHIPFKVYVTLHSFGEVIIFPLAHSHNLCPDYIRLLSGATVMSRAIYNTHGTTYKVGVSKDMMYIASGTSNDWSYQELGIPYCYLIELRSRKHRFKLPEEEIQETSLEILNCMKALMAFVDTYPMESGDHKDTMQQNPQNNRTREEQSKMDVMVEGPRRTQVTALLTERDISFTVAVSNLSLLMTKERRAVPSRACSSNSNNVMDWENYHRLNTINSFMDQLAEDYPHIVTILNIGKSVEGRNIKLIKISNGNESNSPVWIDGSIHPREWIGAAVVTYIANTIVHSFHDLPSTASNKDWYILPVLNPDGYEYTHTHDRMWRKNRARYGECVGVDLNRNFSYGWGVNGEEGSSEDPGNVFFRGPEPFSEPETRAVRKAILDVEKPFKVFISFHSYGEVIIFPWGFTSEPCAHYVELMQGGAAMARAIYEHSGRTYRVGSTKDLMYFAAGTSVDWSYGVANIPYSYMVELRDKKNRFLVPKEDIIATGREVWCGILTLMDFVDQRCRATQTCVCRK